MWSAMRNLEKKKRSRVHFDNQTDYSNDVVLSTSVPFIADRHNLEQSFLQVSPILAKGGKFSLV
jgi:hypothetical protein